MMTELRPLILTLKLDQPTFDHFDQLRQQYFPPARNVLSAHVTLFHKLPPEQEAEIYQVLQSQCAQTPRLPLRLPTVRFLGQGVAIEVECPELVHLRQQLAGIWSPHLSRQDQQGYRPHITIQNKTTRDDARQLYEQLRHTWQPFTGVAEGLLLWRYLDGPWELLHEVIFGGDAEA
ncbi:MAG: 2'-5' RNA ligase family protein [Leptolyngbyaceae cyanobacterium bins.349]|nr:2'-5' RNA ligase family protein [Leptolyngbyaceae cyanobacterium bins.349]